MEVFLHLSEEHERVAKVMIVDCESSSSRGAKMDLTAPIALCVEFSAKYVTFFLSDDDFGMSNSVGLNLTCTNAWKC